MVRRSTMGGSWGTWPPPTVSRDQRLRVHRMRGASGPDRVTSSTSCRTTRRDCVEVRFLQVLTTRPPDCRNDPERGRVWNATATSPGDPAAAAPSAAAPKAARSR
jgi:hypothetical protein